MSHMIVTAIGFVLGVISGFGLSTLLSLLIWAAFWLAIGTAAVALLDVALGLGRRASALRASVRGVLRRWWFRATGRSYGIVVTL